MRNLPLTDATFSEHDPSVAEKNATRIGVLILIGGQPPQGVFFRPSFAWHALLWAGRAGHRKMRRFPMSPVRQPARFRPPRLASGSGFTIRLIGGSHA